MRLMELGECRRGATAVLWIIAAVQKLEGAQATAGMARQEIRALSDLLDGDPFNHFFSNMQHLSTGKESTAVCLGRILCRRRERSCGGQPRGRKLGGDGMLEWCLGSMPADAAWHLTQSLRWQGPFQSRAHRTATPLLLRAPLPPCHAITRNRLLFFSRRVNWPALC